MGREIFQTLTNEDWFSSFPENLQAKCTHSLETGQLIYFPHLEFSLQENEKQFLSDKYANRKRKNISLEPHTHIIKGIKKLTPEDYRTLQKMLLRFSTSAKTMVENLFPNYSGYLISGRTSYRPVQVTNRVLSYRKDDRRLHVDAFPATPNQGKRILRVFTNINPNGEDRVWRIGEPFETVVQQFRSQLSKPVPFNSFLLKLFGMTKSKRTKYDHYMLQLHDLMKGDERYQRKAEYTEIRFPPGSTWIVQTDDVSHAALSGQFLLEQTFYLPVNHMKNVNLSPLKVLERILHQRLV